MIRSAETPREDREEAKAYLEETARAVRVMKSSWLQVALHLQRIRTEELWRAHDPPVANFEEYVHSVLDIPRSVSRRMLQAVSYTQQRRPEVVDRVLGGREDVHVPSYETLDQLRRVQPRFEGREEEFEEIEGRVFDEGLGRVRLRRELRDRLAPEGDAAGPSSADTGEDAAWSGDLDPEAGEAASAVAAGPGEDDLRRVIDDLQAIEGRLVALDASKEARRRIFELVELLQKEASGRASLVP